jgi:hypothetical protein
MRDRKEIRIKQSLLQIPIAINVPKQQLIQMSLDLLVSKLEILIFIF